VSARALEQALEQAIEHTDVDMAAAPAGKDTVGVVEDTGEKQRHSLLERRHRILLLLAILIPECLLHCNCVLPLSSSSPMLSHS